MKIYKKFNDKYIFEYDEGEDGDLLSTIKEYWAFVKVFVFYFIGFWLFSEFCGWLSKIKFGI